MRPAIVAEWSTLVAYLWSPASTSSSISPINFPYFLKLVSPHILCSNLFQLIHCFLKTWNTVTFSFTLNKKHWYLLKTLPNSPLCQLTNLLASASILSCLSTEVISSLSGTNYFTCALGYFFFCLLRNFINLLLSSISKLLLTASHQHWGCWCLTKNQIFLYYTLSSATSLCLSFYSQTQRDIPAPCNFSPSLILSTLICSLLSSLQAASVVVNFFLSLSQDFSIPSQTSEWFHLDSLSQKYCCPSQISISKLACLKPNIHWGSKAKEWAYNILRVRREIWPKDKSHVHSGMTLGELHCSGSSL